jgi:hypothetical protein
VKRLERQAKKDAKEAKEAREAKGETSRIQVGAGANVVLNINVAALASQAVQAANTANTAPQPAKQPKQSSSNKRKGIPKSVRDQSWNRWIGPECGMAPCYCCRENIISKSGFECGHVVPDVFGGKSTVENLRPICLPCNRSMGVSDMRSFCKEFYRDVLDIPYKNKLE